MFKMCLRQLNDVHISLLTGCQDAPLVRKTATVSKAHRKRRVETPPPETITNLPKTQRGNVQPSQTHFKASGEERLRGGGGRTGLYNVRTNATSVGCDFHADLSKER